MCHSKLTLSAMTLFAYAVCCYAKLNVIQDECRNKVQKAECLYFECRYAVCRYTKCHGAHHAVAI